MNHNSLPSINRAIRFGLVVLALLMFAGQANAQVSGKAFEGFKKSDDPIQIEADELEVLDAKNQAIFTGRVKVRQGTSTITTDKLTVFYANSGAGGEQGDIDRLNLAGNVVVTSGENTATADAGVYVVKTEDVTLDGNVVISQGQNAATGCKLRANLKTNIAYLDSCGRRLKMILTPGSAKKN